jgi:hypothetical protein
MALVSDGGTIYTAPYLSNAPSIPAVTFFCWVRFPTTVAGSQTLLSLSGTTTSSVGFVKTSATNAQSIIYNDDSNTNQRAAGETGLTPQANTWVPLCGIATSVSSTTLMTTRNTTTNTTVTGTIVATNVNWNQVQFMALLRSSTAAQSFLNTGGALAELAIWNVALTTLEAQTLVFARNSPWRVRPGNLLCYMPLRWNTMDYGPMGLAFTPSGTNTCAFTQDHPPVWAPQMLRRTWLYAPLPGIHYNQTVNATDASVAAMFRQPGLLRSAAGPSVIGMVRQVGWRQGTLSTPQVAAVAPQSTRRRSTTASTVQAARLARGPLKLLGAPTQQASRVVRAMGATRSASTAQSGAVAMQLAWLRSFAVTQAQALLVLAGLGRRKALSFVNAQIAALVAAYLHAGVNTGRVASAAQAQIAAAVRAPAKRLGTGTAMVATVARLLALHLAFVSPANTASSLRRLVSATHGAALAQVAGRGVAVAKSFLVSAIATATAMVLGRQTLRSPAVAQAQTARLFLLSSRGALLSVVNTASAALSIMVSRLRAIATSAPQAVGLRLGLSTSLRSTEPQSAALRAGLLIFRSLSVAATAVAALFRATGRTTALSTAQPQAPDVIPVFSHQHLLAYATGVVQPRVVALSRGAALTRGVAIQLAAAAIRWTHRFLPARLRARLVWLPPPQDATTLPPSLRRILLPLETAELSGHAITQAEPTYFSPFDPTDEDTFTFDWSRRGHPNDRIIFATVTSVPPGLNFLGPAFIDGSLVDITLGPFTPPYTPITYALRCQAVFASGRISNYSIPVIVKPL